MAKQTFLKIFLACCALVVPSTTAHADPFTFSLLPAGGTVSGTPGSTVGWGYTVANLSTNWLLTTNLSADLFLNGTPNALFDFPILAPGALGNHPKAANDNHLKTGQRITTSGTLIPTGADRLRRHEQCLERSEETT
ncbi:MAG TPA: hypothetical protein VE422_32780, partial [Terriglobia bacterium]|nr:hypothetical protein [Terriglobia bacterium]